VTATIYMLPMTDNMRDEVQGVEIGQYRRLRAILVADTGAVLDATWYGNTDEDAVHNLQNRNGTSASARPVRDPQTGELDAELLAVLIACDLRGDDILRRYLDL
jgi:hypothetical protein